MTNTERLKARMDAAVGRLEAEKARLYRPDGSKLYGEEEHAERMGAIASEIGAVAEEVSRAADKIVEAKREAIDAVLYADPTEELSAEELGQANARAAFVREDCETMDPGELARRIRGVLAGGDKATCWLYRRYATARHEQDTILAYRGALDLSPDEVAAYAELGDALPGLEGFLRDPAKERRRKAAEAEIGAAVELKMHAARRRSEVDGTDARAREAQRERVRSIL